MGPHAPPRASGRSRLTWRLTTLAPWLGAPTAGTTGGTTAGAAGAKVTGAPRAGAADAASAKATSGADPKVAGAGGGAAGPAGGKASETVCSAVAFPSLQVYICALFVQLLTKIACNVCQWLSRAQQSCRGLPPWNQPINLMEAAAVVICHTSHVAACPPSTLERMNDRLRNEQPSKAVLLCWYFCRSCNIRRRKLRLHCHE